MATVDELKAAIQDALTRLRQVVTNLQVAQNGPRDAINSAVDEAVSDLYELQVNLYDASQTDDSPPAG